MLFVEVDYYKLGRMDDDSGRLLLGHGFLFGKVCVKELRRVDQKLTVR